MRIVKLIERRCKISAAYLYVFEVSFRCIAIGGIEGECIGVSYAGRPPVPVSVVSSANVLESPTPVIPPVPVSWYRERMCWNPPRLITSGTCISGIESECVGISYAGGVFFSTQDRYTCEQKANNDPSGFSHFLKRRDIPRLHVR